MYKDKLTGLALLVVSIVIVIAYGWLMFFAPEFWSVMALKVTAISLIAIVFGILGWIGYTLATTPPPKPIEEIEREVEQELKKLETEMKTETKP